MSGRWLFEGGIVVPSADPRGVLHGGCVGVDGERIAFVAERPPAGWQADRLIDCRGKLVLPGLINAHCHAAMTLLRGYGDDLRLQEWLFQRIFPAEEKLTGDDVYWGTLLALAEMTRAGVTSYADMYFHMDAVARATAESGMRGSLARGLVGALGASGLQDSERFHREWHGAADGRITVMLGPHAVYTCSPEYLRQVSELAGKLGADIHIHLSENREEVDGCQRDYGCSPVEQARRCGIFEHHALVAHAVHVTAPDIDILARARGAVVHNPNSNLKLASGVAPVEEMRAAGVTVAIGTDGAASSNTLDIIEAVRHAAFMQKVSLLDAAALPAAETFRMATEAGARALNLADRIGRLEPGTWADLILLDLNRPHLVPFGDPYSLLAYAARADDVEAVYVAGRPLMESRRLLRIDEERVLAECRARASRLWSATPGTNTST